MGSGSLCDKKSVMFGLCDCNNFFASCERVFNPALNNRPVVVLSNNDGCIVARSNEAKKLGFKMGQPIFQVKELVQKHNVAVFSSNYQLYGDLSQRIMHILKELVPQVEIYSIDEAFLNFHGFTFEMMHDYSKKIIKTIKQNVGMPVSLGIAPTKTLAKVAAKLCKKFPKLEGVCILYRPEDITKVLTKFPIEDIWGIGYRYSKMLKKNGIETAEQFRQLSPDWVRAKMSVVGLRTWKELHAEPCISFVQAPPEKQSICVSRSFSKEISELEALQAVVSNFVALAAVKLRNQDSFTGQMQVFIYGNRFRKDIPQHYDNYLVAFQSPTDSTLEMVKYAVAALKQIYKSGFGYKKAGVILYDIMPNTGYQRVLFDEIDRAKHSDLMKSIDEVNRSFGRNMVKMGVQGNCKIPMASKHLSPCFTTQWDEILVIRV